MNLPQRLPPDRSDDIDLIASALSKAQGEIGTARRNAKNSFLGSSYADLTSVVDAIRKPLADNGLAISQTFLPSGEKTLTVTTLLHESGQFLRGFLSLLNVADWHSLGSAISYARRYSITSMLGVTVEDGTDDDGVKAMGQDKPKRKPRARKHEQEESLKEMKKIIAGVDGADAFLRGVGVDPGNPPANIREKILTLGRNGLAMKIFEQRKKEAAEEIVEESDKLKTQDDADALVEATIDDSDRIHSLEEAEKQGAKQ